MGRTPLGVRPPEYASGVTARPDDLHELESTLLDAIAAIQPLEQGPHAGDDCSDVPLDDIFDAQIDSRILDHSARWLRAQGHGFYTIGSAGHESNAAVAAALRLTDPALLHYRSGGFYCARARQRPGHSAVTDVLAGMLALSEEPISGGRHKVFGHRDLSVIPQTSTIASHLPRAVGMALAIGRTERLGVECQWPYDSLVVCSFGDASANHSTAQGAVNAACYSAHARLPVPLLFVCEDNGLGISVPTPDAWIETSFRDRPHLTYEQVDGSDPIAVYRTVAQMADEIRSGGEPGLLHLRTVRFLGHAGTDVEAAYRSPAAMRADEARDPILGTAIELVELGADPAELVERYLDRRAEVREMASALLDGSQLTSADEIMAPLSPRRSDWVKSVATTSAAPAVREEVFEGHLPEDGEPLTLAETINRTLIDVFAAAPHTMLFGEDVGVKGGVYGVTRGLQKRFGAARVFDTLLDEQSILGFALGAGVSGLLPIPEIQYLAYLHNAEDQLRGEAASLQFFSSGQYRNPMVVRIAGYAYQRGFGGHFHNDNSVAVLRDIPGLVVASPSHPSDAAAMLRTCVAAAISDGTISAFVEPIARYHTRDLHEPGDDVWTAAYAPPERWADEHVEIGDGRLVREGDDVLIVSWANGLYMSLQAARTMAEQGVSCRVFDLRWLNPLPVEQLLAHAGELGRVLVVDETRHSGGVGEAVITALAEGGYRGEIGRVAARDSFVPLGDAADLVLVHLDEIVEAAQQLASA